MSRDFLMAVVFKKKSGLDKVRAGVVRSINKWKSDPADPKGHMSCDLSGQDYEREWPRSVRDGMRDSRVLLLDIQCVGSATDADAVYEAAGFMVEQGMSPSSIAVWMAYMDVPDPEWRKVNLRHW